MNYLLLGLLNLKDLTIYEMRAFLKNGMYLMYSDSLGSIQFSIKKLLEQEFITYTEYVEKGKNKKQYTITDDGRKAFFDWLSIPMSADKLKNTDVSKLFFLGTIDAQKRIPLLDAYIVSLQTKEATLLAIQTTAEQVPLVEKTKEIAQFRLLTIKLAVDTLQFELSWYQKLLKNIKKEELS